MPPCGTAKLYINIMCKMYACHVGYKSVIYVTDIQYCIKCAEHNSTS